MKLELLFLTILLKLTKQEKTLIFALTHFRHGARAPIFPSEDNQDFFNKSWDNPSQLTGVGHRMHYILGLYNSERYITELKLLSPNFDEHDILVMSTDFNRTINSALSQLYGLYPSFNGKITEKQKNFANPPIDLSDSIKSKINVLNENNYYLPNSLNLIPIHIFHNSEHRIKEFENPSCKNVANEIMKKNINNSEITKRLSIFTNNFSEIIKKHLKYIQTFDYEKIEKLADQFITDMAEGHDFEIFKNNTEIQNTTFQNLYEFFLDFAGSTMKDYQYGDSEGQLIKIDMSPFFNELVEYIQKRVNIMINQIETRKNDFSSPKLVMISGHDSTLTSMMLFLGIMFKNENRSFYYRNPIYASNAAFEVYVEEGENLKESNFVIEYYFNGKYIDRFNFVDFKEKVKNVAYTPEEIGKICGYNTSNNGTNTNQNSSSTALIVFIILTIILAIVVVILFIIILKGKGINSTNIESLNMGT